MRIFYFSRIDISREDASTRHVSEFCCQMAILGHDITLFIPDLGSRKSLDGVKMAYVPVFSKKPSVTFISFYLSLFFVFLVKYFQLRPDVVYTRHQQMEWLCTWLRLLLKFIYVVEVNGHATHEMKMNSVSPWKVFMVHWMEFFLFRLADQIVTSSAHLRSAFCRDYGLDPDHFLVVSNAANPESFQPRDVQECRRSLGLGEDKRYLLFLGSFKKWHALDPILEAVPALVLKYPDLHLMMVGDGEQRSSLETLSEKLGLKDRVLFMGQKVYEEVPVWINSADICLASLKDHPGVSPLKIFDYMSCGKPVVSNGVGGLKEFFEQHAIGVLVESMSSEAWQDAISQLLDDPERIASCGANGRSAVLKFFNWEYVCGQIEKTLKSLVNS